jgi:hypothetical protein
LKTRLQNRFARVDAAALLVFVAVWAYYFFVVRYGFCFPDEGLYVAGAERFVHGDRPLVDEWHLGQLCYLFLCLPYRIFAALKGGTDGVILFMRCLFLAFNAVFYWFMYIRLRAYRWLALISTALFCAYVPFVIYACNYYTVPIRLMMVVCLILFADRPKPISLLAAGVLFACCVLCQPGFVFLYLGYTVFVWLRFLRQKKGKRWPDGCAFCADIKVWKYLTAGVLVCAVVFSAWLLTRSGLRNILTSVPYLLLTDPEYDFSAQGGARWIFFTKLADAAKVFGMVCVIPAIVLVALSIAYACGLIRARRAQWKKILFCLACAIWILSCVQPFRPNVGTSSDVFASSYCVPLLWFGLVCYLLCDRRNSRFLLFWIAGLCSSLCVDFFSDAAMSVGCPISYIADAVFFADLVREFRADTDAKKNVSTEIVRSRKSTQRLRGCVRWCARVTCVGFAAWFVFVLLVMENPIVPARDITGAPFSAMTFRCENGPLQGLRCSEAYGKNYNDKLADIDALKSKNPKNLYVCGLSPELYLYAGLPCSTSSSYSWRTTQYLNRHVRYWLLHPERLPECVYFPMDQIYNKSSGEQLRSWISESFDPLCDYTLETGRTGFILYVTQWRLDAADLPA